ncbi:MAG: hypothetical protein AAF249_07235 [Pseudomonadota bacterium]
MKYPNRMQAALLFDQRTDRLDAIAQGFARVFKMKSGATFNTVEHTGSFVRLFGGGDELMLTFEYVDGPPKHEVFAQAVGSPMTGILCPDMGSRLVRAQGMILLEVSHGAIGGVEENPKIAAMLDTLGMKQGATPEQFTRRLETLALMTRIAIDEAAPSVIHWTQSNQLFEPKVFDGFAEMGFPGPLAIHPYLFGPDDQDARTSEDFPEGEAKAGIRTFGARHWLGREIYVAPTTLPWGAAFQTILAFCRLATMEGGYVIPDGDTFGPEGGGEKWRVRHRDIGEVPGDVTAEEGGVPLYELVPLRHDECGFLDPDFASEQRVVCEAGGAIIGDMSAEELYGEDAKEIAAARSMVESVGGTLTVTALDERPSGPEDGGDPPAPEPTPPEPPAPAPAVQASQPRSQPNSQPGEPALSGRGLRARVFGRKGL